MQALEHADLDLLGREPDEAVEAGGESGQILAGQPDDEVRVHVHPGALAQEAQVPLDRGIVLAAVDALEHDGIEALDADLELQRPRRKAREDLAQGLGQPVGDRSAALAGRDGPGWPSGSAGRATRARSARSAW